MRYTVCAVTGSRAEYGILRPLLLRLKSDGEINFRLVVTGSHLSADFGCTEQEILEDGFEISARVPIPTRIDSKADMICATGAALSAFGGYFSENRPELLMILGDRYEIFAVAAAAAMLAIPIAHLHGGESTEGAVDEFLRHSITKMSTLHFTACETYRRRVIQLGEAPERVFAFGALSVENALSVPLLPLEALGESIGAALTEKRYCVVTFHPVTMEQESARVQLFALIHAMEQYPQYHFIITKSNADSGGGEINHIWEEQGALHPNWTVIASLGMRRYLSALRYAAAMIGNSSSGIVEGPAMKIPTVNIGDRQKGRMMAPSVLCCPSDCESILRVIRKALSPDFQSLAAQMKNPFGGADISYNMLLCIKRFLSNQNFTARKSFYDLTGERSCESLLLG